jgi:SH3-like domain-containing protein
VNTFTRRAIARASFVAALTAVFVCLAAHAADAPRQGTLKGDRVNVRVAPDLKAETLTQLNKGAPVSVLETKSATAPGKDGAQKIEWLRIAMPESAKVYVHKDFVANGVVTAETLNVRSGPANTHAIVATLKRGERVDVLATKGNWFVIRPPANATAWIAAQYVEVGAPVMATGEPRIPDIRTPEPRMPEPPPHFEQPRTVEFIQRDGILRIGVLLPADEHAPAGATHKLNVEGTRGIDFTLCYIKWVNPDLRPERHIGKHVRVRGREIWERGQPCPLMEVDFLQREWNVPTSGTPRNPNYGW